MPPGTPATGRRRRAGANHASEQIGCDYHRDVPPKARREARFECRVAALACHRSHLFNGRVRRLKRSAMPATDRRQVSGAGGRPFPAMRRHWEPAGNLGLAPANAEIGTYSDNQYMWVSRSASAMAGEYVVLIGMVLS